MNIHWHHHDLCVLLAGDGETRVQRDYECTSRQLAKHRLSYPSSWTLLSLI